MSSTSVDDGTLATSVATVGLIPLLGCAADSKSGRRDNASATTLSRSGSYSTEKLYSAKKEHPPRHPLGEVWNVYGRD